jgi:GT2 family glycosyltransferase
MQGTQAPSKTMSSLKNIFTESKYLYELFADLYIPDPFLTGDAFIANRELINKTGSFDPLFYSCFADHDDGPRAKIAGLETLLAPGAYAVHQTRSNLSYLNKEDQDRKLSLRLASIHENRARFKLKYGISVETLYTFVNNIDRKELATASLNQ